MKKISIIIIGFLFGIQTYSQENIFLKREFWDTKPSIETINLKIKEGNDIAEATSSNFDGVVYAILQEAPNTSIEYAISKEGNDVNKLTHDGRTYIFWAAYKGNVELMQHLISKGAKTNLTDDKGSTIMNFAALSGQKNTKVYDVCLANGADLKKETVRNRNAVPRQRNSGRERLLPGEGSVFFQRVKHACHGTRHSRRLQTEILPLLVEIAFVV